MSMIDTSDDSLPEDSDAEAFGMIDRKASGLSEAEPQQPQPAYQIYEGSRIAVSRALGPRWEKVYEATRATYQDIYLSWDEAFRYYNNNQAQAQDTPRGIFKRGDSSENLVFSNINVMLPAVYSKDPDITINSSDESDQPFQDCLKQLLNALFKRRYLLNAKPKLKRAVGYALLTNSGVIALDYTQKDDSVEHAAKTLQEISKQLQTAKTQSEVDDLYGQLEALEDQMEVMEKNGPQIRNVLPQNLLVDPDAELPDATDGAFMFERLYLKTAFLNAKYTKKEEGQTSVYIYKPTHKAVFNSGEGKRDDGLGMVLAAVNADDVTRHESQERNAFRTLYYTECVKVWDKTTRRVYLFAADSWAWPIWVWDDPLKLSRFYPYFIMGFGFSTGGSTTVGEVSYYLDQQDEINDINRKVVKMRRGVFDYWFFDSTTTNREQVMEFLKAVRGVGDSKEYVVGIQVPDGKKLEDMISTIKPPTADMEPLLKKEPIMEAMNRLSGTSDALRGVQFKTNTNEAAVQSYQDAARMIVGAKIDVLEDMMSDLAQSLAEVCVQFMDPETIMGIIGTVNGLAWNNMTVEDLNARFSMEVVAGTTEKANSTFKKKEAIQIAQAVGQFSNSAPGTTLKIILKVLEQAFTEVVIKPEDWKAIEAEATQQATKGVSTPGAPGAPPAAGNPASAGPAGPQSGSAAGPAPINPQALLQAALKLPPAQKQKIVQMKQQGAPPQQILQAIQQLVGGGGGAQAPQPPQQPAPGPQAPVSQQAAPQQGPPARAA